MPNKTIKRQAEYVLLETGCALLVFLFLFTSALTGQSRNEQRIDFLAIGDPQYVAEKSDNPTSLDPKSNKAAEGFIRVVRQLPGTVLETDEGKTRIPESVRGMIVAGDLINSLDKYGGPYPAMQKFEWQRYKKDFGLAGGQGRISLPVYEVYGNHDGPQGKSFLVDELKKRNRKRPNVVNVSQNGIHYSWDWGPVHFIALGMFVGEGDEKKADHHYAPRESLAFLKKDLREHVGNSDRPVIITHHLHVHTNDYDWPDEDKMTFYNTIKKFNVIAVLHGHTHGDPNRYFWNGKETGSDLERPVRVFDTGNCCASKIHNGETVGRRHGFLYMTVINRPGVENDRLHAWSFFTEDNWESHSQREYWKNDIAIP